jgi:endogenous inhibitor of DNA gyrase (YacG/DUF329 family)
MTILICKQCGKEYSVLPHDANKRKYCSYECKNDSQKKLTIQVCGYCGKEYTINWAGNHRKYCSAECNDKDKDTKIETNCTVCGKSFLARPLALANGLDKYCSNKCRYRGVQSGGGLSWKAGKRSDLGNTYFRSSWEANYARLLNHYQDRFVIKSWEFEPDAFDLDGIVYIPDFKVIDTNGDVSYHEVKGWMDKGSKKKIEMMRTINSDINFLVIDSEKYNVIEQVYSDMIPNWEGA